MTKGEVNPILQFSVQCLPPSIVHYFQHCKISGGEHKNESTHGKDLFQPKDSLSSTFEPASAEAAGSQWQSMKAWRELHCSVYSARDSSMASWSSRRYLINAGFRSAALWTAAEGEGKGRDQVVCSHTGAVCCPLRAELISSCTTERAQLRGWGSLDISPSMSRRWKLEAASSHNTATAPTAHAAWAGQLQKSTKQAADATWNHRSRQVSASEFLNLLGRNRKEWRNKNAICIC